MRKSKRLWPLPGVAIVLFVLIAPFFGCGRNGETELGKHGGTGGSLRVVALAPSITEIVTALGRADSLVGVSRHCPELIQPSGTRVPSVGRIDQPDLESILALAPDLVLLSGLTPRETEARLTALGLRTERFEHVGLAGLMEDVGRIGEVLHASAAAQALRTDWNARIARVEAAAAGAHSRPKTLLLYNLSNFYSAGRGSFVGDLIELAGGENLASSAPSAWPQLDREAIIAGDPEILIVVVGEGACSEAATDDLRQRLQADPLWRPVRAVREGRIALVGDNLLSIPGPRTIEALERMSTIIAGD